MSFFPSIICSKSDALSNYHPLPRPVTEEAIVRTHNNFAQDISSEEVLPLHVINDMGESQYKIFIYKRGWVVILRV